MKKLVKKLNLEQRIAYEAVKSGMNVFITGGGGVGKSFLIDVLSASFPSMAVLAPTGIAALNVSGETLHSFFKIPFGTMDISFATRLKRGDKKRINAAKIILIDEISMTRCDTLDIIDQKLRLVTGKNLPFGGKQVVIVGDFAQIEPVARKGTDEYRNLIENYGHNFYAFKSKVWERAKLTPFVLTEPVRHGEDELIKALRNIRMGNNIEKSIAFLNQRVANDYNIDTLKLVTTNYQCDDNNEDRYERLEGKEYVYEAEITGEYKERPSPEELFLKVGCRVIFTTNGAEDEEYVNGDMGEVIKLTDNLVTVQLDRGITVIVGKFKFESHAFEPDGKGDLERKVKGTFKQIPLKLAYSITIHKSQGATLDNAVVDLSSGSFAYGQVYVALSRVRTLAGLYLTKPLLVSDIKINREAVEYTKKVSLEALQRREEDIKRFKINVDEITSEIEVDESEVAEESKEKTLKNLKKIIVNQIAKKQVKNRLRVTLEHLEEAGITTYFELDDKKILDGGFVYKGYKYPCEDIFNMSLRKFLTIRKLIEDKTFNIDHDLEDYIKFLNERAEKFKLAESSKPKKEEPEEVFNLSRQQKDRLKVALNKLEEACKYGELEIEILEKLVS